MALNYHVVMRPDVRKNATPGDKLAYGQVRAGDKVSYSDLCDEISSLSTASRGDVSCVLEGLIYILQKYLLKGSVVQLREFGNFRMVAGSHGVENPEDFTASLFKKGRIVFTPGTILNDLRNKVQFRKLDVVSKMEICDRVHAA